jgi:LmbE family N-acetylglucosaminyl deacetylase
VLKIVRTSVSLLRVPAMGRRLALLVCLGFALLLAASPAGAGAATCGHTDMFFAAHEDDDILFMSPDLLEDVEAGDCVRTVFLTAGDAGESSTYWHEREAGSRAAYAEMAGVADSWTESTPIVDGQAVHLSTLDGQPQISEVYLRLPDGGPEGEGFPSTDFQSLPKLWQGQNDEPSWLSPITQITTVDGAATYTYEGLLGTLEALIDEFEPEVIGVQDFATSFGSGDHFDHIAGGKFVQLASAADSTEHVLRAFTDYATRSKPQNVFEPQLAKKLDAYFNYAPHDSGESCSSQAECEAELPSYWKWLQRQYVASETTVPGAEPPAGPDLALNHTASASSVEEGGFEAAKANDGNPATRWISAYSDDQWWQVDLGGIRPVNEVRIDWAAAYGSQYRIETSIDGNTFTTAAEVTDTGAGLKTTTFAARGARYVRVQGVTRGTQWGYSFWTAEVFGPEPEPANEPTAAVATAPIQVDAPGPLPSSEPPLEAITPACKVPRLKGKSLEGAKKALAKAGCRLGRVTRKEGTTPKTARVVFQDKRAGKRLPPGTRVSARLG